MNREMRQLRAMLAVEIAVLVIMIVSLAICCLMSVTTAKTVSYAADVLLAAAPARNAAVVEAVEPPTETEAEPAPEDVSTPRYALSDTERDLIERVVAAEARGEPLEGMQAVAQCILNTCEATNQRPDAVVLSPKQYANPVDFEVSGDVRDAVSAVFDDGETVFDETIRWFYSPAGGRSDWHEESLTYVGTVGGHRFFS